MISDRFDLPTAVSVAFSVAFSVAVSVAVFETRHKPSAWSRFTAPFVLQIALLIIVTRFWAPGPEGRDYTAYIVVFLGVFPFLNAVADFASCGLTRYLLRDGLTRRTPWQALKDALGGIGIFFLLGFALIVYIRFVIPSDGIPLINLAAIFAGLDNDPGAYWWLGFMLLSTLLPTVIHTSIFIATAAFGYWTGLRKFVIWLFKNGRDGSHLAGFAGSAAVSSMVVFSFWLPIWAFYWLFQRDHTRLLDGVIAVFRWWAGVVGAL